MRFHAAAVRDEMRERLFKYESEYVSHNYLVKNVEGRFDVKCCNTQMKEQLLWHLITNLNGTGLLEAGFAYHYFNPILGTYCIPITFVETMDVLIQKHPKIREAFTTMVNDKNPLDLVDYTINPVYAVTPTGRLNVITNNELDVLAVRNKHVRIIYNVGIALYKVPPELQAA